MDCKSWFGSVRISTNGYYRINSGPRRDEYLHRAVWERIAGYKLPEGWHVHHQDNNKLHCCGENLIAMPAEFNPRREIRHPWTGQYLSKGEFERLMR